MKVTTAKDLRVLLDGVVDETPVILVDDEGCASFDVSASLSTADDLAYRGFEGVDCDQALIFDVLET